MTTTQLGALDDPRVIDEWRREFPILSSVIHLGNCSQAPQAKRVRGAIASYLDNWLTVGMDWATWMGEVAKAKAEFARLINAEPSEVAISTSVSVAVASVVSALNLTGSRRKVVSTEAEFPGVGHAWLGHQKYGCKVEFVPVREGKVALADYQRYIDDETLVTSVPHVHYQTGFKQDLKSVIDLAHSRGSLVLTDVYQSIGTTPIDVKELGVDFLVTGNLKYLLGIPGIAFLYVKKDLIPTLKPAIVGWFGQENPFDFHVHYLDYASDNRRFETGTPPVLAAYAARAGMEIINEVGPAAIEKRIEALSRVAIDGAKARGFVITSPEDVRQKGATTTIQVPHPHAVEAELRQQNIIVSARGNGLRIAPHFYTLPEEIETTLDALARILRK